MKYLLASPIIFYYLMRDMATLLKHGELLRGLIIFILLSVVIMLACILMNTVQELKRVRKQVGANTYDWMVR